MNAAVSRILRRILPLALVSIGTEAAATGVAYTEPESQQPQAEEKMSKFEQATKLVFGRAREGLLQLTAHRSHSSHSSHRSHSSHSSHYSGSGGGGYSSPAQPSQPSYVAPAPAPRPAPPPPPSPAPPPPAPPAPPVTTTPPAGQLPPVEQPESGIIAEVLKKLPKVRSRWPATAKLTKATRFQLYEGDRVVGMFELTPGATIKVVEIKLQHAIIKLPMGNSPVPVLNTDIINVMGGVEKVLALPDDPVSVP